MNGAGGALRPSRTSDTRVLELSTTCTVVHDEFTENLDRDAFSTHGAP